MPGPILFPIAGVHNNLSRKLGVAPNFCGGRLLPTARYTITGVTKDETGAAAGGFTVYLFDMTSGTPSLVQSTVSDGSGNYSFSVGLSLRYWIVDYKSGAPDKAGATRNDLTGTQSA